MSTTTSNLNASPQAASEDAAAAAMEEQFSETISQISQRENGQQQLRQGQRQRKYEKCRIRKVLSTAAILLALLLIVGAIYMHLKQKHHFGRLNIDLAGKDASEITLPFPAVTAPAVAELNSGLLVSEDCLECIAATATANKPAMCGKSPCGVYRIYRPYWQDVLRLKPPPTIGSEDYESCVSNSECAAEIVRGYIALYGQDCNGDGAIRCQDHIMLHIQGPTGCLRNPLMSLFRTRMLECLRLKELE